MRTARAALFAAAGLLVAAPSRGGERPRPPARVRPVFITKERLATLRLRVQKGVEPTASAFRKVKGVADRELDREPHILKEWYVPGYYRDAKGHSDAKRGLQEDANVAYQQALCYRVTGDEKYARSAVRLVHAWATGVETTSRKDDSTLSFSYHFPAMVFGADLLRVSPAFTPESQLAFAAFLREKALPLNTMRAKNNWGNWGLVLVMAVAAYLDDQALFEKGVGRWKEFLDEQIGEEGHLHHEVTRNGGRGEHGIWYSHFSLMPQTIAAEIARVNGVDLYDYTSPRGRTVRRAFEVLAGWTRRPETFPYFKGDPKRLAGVTYYSYFEILNAHWPNEDASALLARRRPMTAGHSAPALTFTHGGLFRDTVVVRRPRRPEARKISPPPERKKAGAEAVAEWDAKLLARVRSELAAGRHPSFRMGSTKQSVVSVDPGRVLSLRSRGVEMRMDWSRLSMADRKNLALSCVVDGDPSSHAVAAFFLLAAGEVRGAEEHLAEAPDHAAAVRKAFE